MGEGPSFFIFSVKLRAVSANFLPSLALIHFKVTLSFSSPSVPRMESRSFILRRAL